LLRPALVEPPFPAFFPVSVATITPEALLAGGPAHAQ
jgi:hypothetical protein